MKLLFLGDFFYDYDYISKDIEEIINFINKNDYKVIINLETAVLDAQRPIKKRGPNLKSDHIILEILKRMHCVCVCLANNHAMDYGKESLLATKEALEEVGIQCVGGGRNLKQAIEPARIWDGNKEIIVQNYGWDIEETVYASENGAGCAPLNRDEIVNRTSQLKNNNPNAVLINCLHMGFEFNVYPMPLDILFAHKCLDCGCDLIIGHHPHIIQPKEKYMGREIYYSLGNFYFASRRNGFREQYEKDSVEGYGDYGLGVVLDVDTLETTELIIHYNRENAESGFEDRYSNLLLPVFPELDWRSNEYMKFAADHAYKNNPILGLNENINKEKLRRLTFKYSIAGKLQKIRKYELGDKLYSFIKERA